MASVQQFMKQFAPNSAHINLGILRVIAYTHCLESLFNNGLTNYRSFSLSEPVIFNCMKGYKFCVEIGGTEQVFIAVDKEYKYLWEVPPRSASLDFKLPIGTSIRTNTSEVKILKSPIEFSTTHIECLINDSVLFQSVQNLETGVLNPINQSKIPFNEQGEVKAVFLLS